MKSVPVPRPRRKSKPQPAAAPVRAWLDHCTDAALLLARWTNAVAILNVLADEFAVLSGVAARSNEAVALLRPDHKAIQHVRTLVIGACEAASVAPFRGSLDALDTVYRPAVKGGAR